MSRSLINLISNASEALVGKGDELSGDRNSSEHKINPTEPGAVLKCCGGQGPGISAENLQKSGSRCVPPRALAPVWLPRLRKFWNSTTGGLKSHPNLGEAHASLLGSPSSKNSRRLLKNARTLPYLFLTTMPTMPMPWTDLLSMEDHKVKVVYSDRRPLMLRSAPF